ncbi:hypothetical protein LC607_29765 [Nostoc sp. CHAB 5824]|nr:hypothetical protein [Nostoc sp. CHAB 5824]
MDIFNSLENREQRKWGYGTNPEHEVPELTSTEVMLHQYVEDNSAILKRGFWAKRHSGIILVDFAVSPTKLSFIEKSTLSIKLPSNVADDALNFLNSDGKLHRYSEGLITVGKLGNDYSIQDYPLQGRNVGLPYLVE